MTDVCAALCAAFDETGQPAGPAIALLPGGGSVSVDVDGAGAMRCTDVTGTYALRWCGTYDEAGGEGAASMRFLESELHMWRLYLAATSEYRSWELHVAHEPSLATAGGAFASQTLRQGALHDERQAWAARLQQLAHGISANFGAALTVRESALASVPSVADVAAMRAARTARPSPPTSLRCARSTASRACARGSSWRWCTTCTTSSSRRAARCPRRARRAATPRAAPEAPTAARLRAPWRPTHPDAPTGRHR
eukprot:5173976-Prymnesium_polylepis.1